MPSASVHISEDFCKTLEMRQKNQDNCGLSKAMNDGRYVCVQLLANVGWAFKQAEDVIAEVPLDEDVCDDILTGLKKAFVAAIDAGTSLGLFLSCTGKLRIVLVAITDPECSCLSRNVIGCL